MIRKEMNANLAEKSVQHPVAMFVQVANQFDCRIYVETETARINAKSILGMMTLGMDGERRITISADGPDEKEAMERLEEVLSTGA